MKLIQINAWLGRVNGPLVRFIAEQQPDFICMQEAYFPNPDGPKVLADQYNFLDQIREASKLPHEFFAKSWGMNIGDALYDEGNVILSRFPLSEQKSVHTNGEYHIRNNQAAAIANTRVWQGAVATLPDGKQLSLATYHGYLEGPYDTGNETTVATMRVAHDQLATLPRPLIFAGDLNVWPISPAISLLDDLGLKNLTVEYDIPTTLSEVHRAPEHDRVRAACDYVFVSPEITVQSFSASEVIISDHKALILEFDV